MINKMSIADAMRSVMTQIREQTAEHNKKWEMYSEVQRLRAALYKITQIYDDPNLHDLTACHEMNRVAKEALSTTNEPTNAAKVEQFECPCCGCEISIKPNPELPKGEESE